MVLWTGATKIQSDPLLVNGLLPYCTQHSDVFGVLYRTAAVGERTCREDRRRVACSIYFRFRGQ